MPPPSFPNHAPPAGIVAAAVVVLAALALPAAARAQEAQANVEPEAADSVEAPPSTGRPSPGGAFLRSVLVPGWGQAASGAYGEAAVYLLVQAGNVWMAYKTNSLRGSARRRQQMLEAAKTAELLRAGVAPDALEAELAADERIEDIRLLVDARDNQMEDWVALLVFFAFFGGAHAFVSAHLADFPAPLTVEPVAGPSCRAVRRQAALPPSARSAEAPKLRRPHRNGRASMCPR